MRYAGAEMYAAGVSKNLISSPLLNHNKPGSNAQNDETTRLEPEK